MSFDIPSLYLPCLSALYLANAFGSFLFQFDKSAVLMQSYVLTGDITVQYSIIKYNVNIPNYNTVKKKVKHWFVVMQYCYMYCELSYSAITVAPCKS